MERNPGWRPKEGSFWPSDMIFLINLRFFRRVEDIKLGISTIYFAWNNSKAQQL